MLTHSNTKWLLNRTPMVVPKYLDWNSRNVVEVVSEEL